MKGENGMTKEEIQQRIRAIYQDILIDLKVECIDDYFATDYTQVTDHDKVDLAGFKAHLSKLKEVVEKLTVESFKDELVDEHQRSVFLRYDVEVLKKDGSEGVVEVYAIFKFNEDGKLVSCRELTQESNRDVQGLGSIS